MRAFLLAFLIALSSPVLTSAQGIGTIIGGAAAELIVPPAPAMVCEGPGICPQFIDVSSANPQLMIGGVYGGTCYISTTGGGTGSWTACAGSPVGAGSLNGVGVLASGTMVASREDGFGCRISRSVNQGASWTEVFFDAARFCGGGGSGVMNAMRCNGANCAALASSTLPALGAIRSNGSDGASWLVAVDPGAFTFFPPGMAFYDGLNLGGYVASNGQDGATTIDGVTWQHFPGKNVNGCFGTTYYPPDAIFLGGCHIANTSTISLVDLKATNISKDGTAPTGFRTAGQNTIQLAMVKGSLYYFAMRSAVAFAPCAGTGVSELGIFKVTGITALAFTSTPYACLPSFNVAPGDLKIVNNVVYMTNGQIGATNKIMKFQ